MLGICLVYDGYRMFFAGYMLGICWVFAGYSGYSGLSGYLLGICWVFAGYLLSIC